MTNSSTPEAGLIAPTDPIPAAWPLSALAGAVLAGCGGGGQSGDSSGGSASSEVGAAKPAEPTEPGKPAEPQVPPAPLVSAAAAARFLAQASTGASADDISQVQVSGLEAWLNQQFAMPRSFNLFDWMIASGYHDVSQGSNRGSNGSAGLDNALWRGLIESPDTLRQRVAFALSQILVVNTNIPDSWRPFAGAAYMDLLLDHAFGNYRTLLEHVSTSLIMGYFLTFVRNAKANPKTGSLPDENYAREILQLFTIGLYELKTDGTPRLDAANAPIESYDNEDVMGLARVFTGWTRTATAEDVPEKVRRPMSQNPELHELGAKTFLGYTIPAGTQGELSLKLALDHIFAHPNVGPFIGKQLIQRLVTSNPSPAYVERVAGAFNNNGAGVRGDLKAVIRAILLDTEARALPATQTGGKLREPILRFTQWARAFKATSVDDSWEIGNTSDPANGLSQSALRSPSVFNFFRPGFVPGNTALAAQKLVAPEFQITDEVSVVGYINFIQRAIQNQITTIQADYSALLPLSTSAENLVNELALVLAADQLSAATKSTITTAIATISADSTQGKNRRIYAATLLVMASPEFITLR